MNTTEILTKIKTLLGVESEEIKLAQMKLEDGMTIVESENFDEGDEIVIITEDGKVALPEGDYKLEDGRMIVVREEGVIAEVKSEEEKEEKEEKKKEEEYEEVENSEETKEPKKIIKSVSEEVHFTEMENLKKENAELANLYNEVKEELDNLRLNAVEVKEETETVEEKTEEIELAETEKANPIVYNPENKKEVEGFVYSQNRSESTLDRVIKRMNN
jgi:major membrane immunogen (membrane-anchored lipoprotein)